MTLQSTVSPDGKTVTIRIQGRFDFNLHKEFRDAYSGEAAGASHYVIDFKDTEYMDSSALGMLLLLREHAGGSPDRVRLTNVSPELRKILEISNFHHLFKMD